MLIANFLSNSFEAVNNPQMKDFLDPNHQFGFFQENSSKPGINENPITEFREVSSNLHESEVRPEPIGELEELAHRNGCTL